MEICLITDGTRELFGAFIPENYKGVMDKYLCFGFYDDERIQGAAVASISEGLMQILSLRVLDDAPVGECEKALAEMIKSKAKEAGILQAEYIAEGTADVLNEVDINMMLAGFVPRDGEVERYVSTLERICKAQAKNLEIYRKHDMKSRIITADKMSAMELRKYNLKHPDVPFEEWNSDAQMTYFYIKDNEPVAMLMLSENEDDCIVLDWLDRDENADSSYSMYLLYNAMDEMTTKFSLDKRVLVHPFSNEVKQIVQGFDFEVDKEQEIRTHIYTLYIE